MVPKRVTLAAFVWLFPIGFSATALAQNEPPWPVLERMGLAGTWAPSCKAAPSKTNAFVTYYTEKRGLVRRKLDLGPGADAGVLNMTIDAVRQLSPTTLLLRRRYDDPRWGKLNGATDEAVTEISGGHARPLSLVRGGTELIKDGRIVASGNPTESSEKCSEAAAPAPSQPASAQQTTSREPAGQKPWPIMRDIGLTGVWASSCAAAPSLTNPRITYSGVGDGTARYSVDYGANAPPNIVAAWGSGTIVEGRRLSPSTVELRSRLANGDVFRTISEVNGDHSRRVQQMRQDGTVFIRDGKIVANDQPDPPREKCSN